MLALRYAALVAIALWVGGLIALGAVAAPAIFNVIDVQRVADGRMLAGAVFGEVLRRFHVVTYACGAAVLLSLVVRAALGPRPSRFAVRFTLGSVMLAAMLYSGFVLTPAIERARAAAGGAPSSLSDGDPRRVQFGRLHGFSTLLLLVPVLGGMTLLFWELRD